MMCMSFQPLLSPKTYMKCVSPHSASPPVPTSEKRLFLQDWFLELCHSESENGKRNMGSEGLDEKVGTKKEAEQE